MTKQPTPWYTAGAQPKYGITETQGGRMAIQWIPRWNGFIYIKLMYTLPCPKWRRRLLLGRECKRKDGGGQVANCERRSNQLWLPGGRVWQGSTIMEYYHGSFRILDWKLTNWSRWNSPFRLLPFGFKHVLTQQTENQFSIFQIQRLVWAQNNVWSPPLCFRWRDLLFLEREYKRAETGSAYNSWGLEDGISWDDFKTLILQ